MLTTTRTKLFEVIIDVPYEQFTDADQAELVGAIGDLLKIRGVTVIAKNRGSVRLTLELLEEHASALAEAIEAGELERYHVLSGRIITDEPRVSDQRTELIEGLSSGTQSSECTTDVATSVPSSDWREGQEFHVFFAYSKNDRPFIKNVVQATRRRGIMPWFDMDNVPPGESFLKAISDGIRRSDCVAIFIGNEIGQWQKHEIKHSLIKRIDDQKRVIPILLPGVDSLPEDLDFLVGLSDLNPVRFTEKPDVSAMDKLEWAITGINPRNREVDFEIRLDVMGVDVNQCKCFIVPAGSGEQATRRFKLIQAAVADSVQRRTEFHRADPNQPLSTQRALRSSQLVIVDASVEGDPPAHPESQVMYQLGLAAALQKPTIVIVSPATVLPPVANASHLVTIPNGIDADVFREALGSVIADVLDGLPTPRLIEPAEDVAVIQSDVPASLWPAIRDILSLGVRLNDAAGDFREEVKKIEADIDRLCETIKQVDGGAADQLWESFDADVMKYLEAFAKFRAFHDAHFAVRRDDTQKSFNQLSKHLAAQVSDHVQASSKRFDVASDAVDWCLEQHEGLHQHVMDRRDDGRCHRRFAWALRSEIQGLERATRVMKDTAKEMVIDLLKIIGLGTTSD